MPSSSNKNKKSDKSDTWKLAVIIIDLTLGSVAFFVACVGLPLYSNPWNTDAWKYTLGTAGLAIAIVMTILSWASSVGFCYPTVFDILDLTQAFGWSAVTVLVAIGSWQVRTDELCLLINKHQCYPITRSNGWRCGVITAGVAGVLAIVHLIGAMFLFIRWGTIFVHWSTTCINKHRHKLQRLPSKEEEQGFQMNDQIV